jgi:predicted flap endonuclease-1-like 5' DNA nuclease
MSYKIEQIEGIGAAYAAKLATAGIKTTDDLLAKCAAKKGRVKVAEETGISPKLILKWTNHADLFRVNGIAGQFAELLEAAGVDTIKEFRHRVPANLQPKLVAVNNEKNLCNRVPSVAELEKMIAQAKAMEPTKITY